MRNGTDKHALTPDQELLAGAGVTDPGQQEYLAGALHQLGDILHYPDDPEARPHRRPRPEWLNTHQPDARLPAVADRHGLLTRHDVAAMGRPRPRHARSFPADDGQLRHIVPDRRTPTRSASWSNGCRGTHPRTRPTGTPREAAAGDPAPLPSTTVPPGIPTWFIARSHRFATHTHWRTGAIPDLAGLRALRTGPANRGRNTIELTVRGPAPAAFFSSLTTGSTSPWTATRAWRSSAWCRAPAGETPTLFDYHKLIQRLKEHKTAMHCNESDQQVDINHMLLGIAPPGRDHRTGTGLDDIHARLDEVLRKLDGQHEYAQREFMKIQGLHQVRCPSVFTLTANRRRLPGTRTHTLRLYCEQPGAWHQLPDDEGCYPVRLDPWLRATAPHLNRISRVLSGAAQLAMPVLGIAAADLHSRLTDDVANMKELLGQVALADGPLPGRRGGRHGWAEPGTRADDDADFRAIEHLLATLDPQRRWGGLSRTTTPEGLTLFLCRDHAATYRAPSRRPTDL